MKYKNKMKILINTTNIHVGGGVQVASSFIHELSLILKEHTNKFNISILYSTAVKSNLFSDSELSVFQCVQELNVYGVSSLSAEDKKHFDNYDVCFTVFGPFYFKLKVKEHICGFAQPWIAYPDNDVYPILRLFERMKTKARFFIQSFLFKRYEQLIVEQQHVKDALVNQGYANDKIKVVSNCVSTIYDSPHLWKDFAFNKSELKYDITLGFIGRAYVHKNVIILKNVSRLLFERYNFNCNFVFSFTANEMKECGFTELDNFFTVGAIKVEQCPAFYQLLDALVFPSLLECFSASPIEAMKMSTTVFASNYPFVTEVCQNAAFYFDALDANSIAESIVNAFANKHLREEKLNLGRNLVRSLPTARDRAVAYLDIINN
ncbi:glycosyltransferase [Pseudomonadales bacterium]|nr:glycosyltransferase [Pseudomonadales bacterium]MDB9868743.1 glycosyltransferase [Pseudomonadales bacterium]